MRRRRAMPALPRPQFSYRCNSPPGPWEPYGEIAPWVVAEITRSGWIFRLNFSRATEAAPRSSAFLCIRQRIALGRQPGCFTLM